MASLDTRATDTNPESAPETFFGDASHRALLTMASRKAIAATNLDLRAYWSTVYGADGLASAEEALQQMLYDMAPGSCAEGMEFDGTYPAKRAKGKMDLYYRDLTIRNRAKWLIVGVSAGCINFLLKDLTRRGIIERLRLGPEAKLYYRMPMRFELMEETDSHVGILPLDNVQTFVDNEPMPEANTCSITEDRYRGYDNPEGLDPLADGVTWSPSRGYHAAGIGGAS